MERLAIGVKIKCSDCFGHSLVRKIYTERWKPEAKKFVEDLNMDTLFWKREFLEGEMHNIEKHGTWSINASGCKSPDGQTYRHYSQPEFRRKWTQ